MREPMIHCVIVRMSTPEEAPQEKQEGDLLPWADPYICQLIEKLQREVRAERQAARQNRNPRIRDRRPRWNDMPLPETAERHQPRQPR